MAVVADPDLALLVFFFFQAEDGIRDLTVTGVQTCALPIFFASNLFTVLYMSRAALPHMRRARWGRIINMGAVGAERAFGQAKISAYAAAKAAVVALSRSLALEEAKNGINVNVVNPSSIDENELTLDEAR